MRVEEPQRNTAMMKVHISELPSTDCAERKSSILSHILSDSQGRHSNHRYMTLLYLTTVYNIYAPIAGILSAAICCPRLSQAGPIHDCLAFACNYATCHDILYFHI